MYLRSIELTGFKSFAGHTVLNFEPGLTAIVGPNGCGKSNIADAVRWVLGETSAKALRGVKMEDCIFNGTDERKPLGMAEVSVTFADCEAVLGTEYHEVTVTRRVFRSGEGEYFLNRTPCRLKDIQRLFMDTGIGTASYSLMEQGRIDQVLSSRPEDRREIFEEASGITRYKADKKEALRKLEQTEANLLRLDDVIREVKRQIGSLQRQAGKARRYRQLREQLQRLDTYWTARRLEQMDRERQAVESQLAALEARVNVLQAETQAAEAEEARLRAEVLETERAIGAATEARATAQARIEQQTQLVRMNSVRIRELEELAARDRTDLEEAQRRAEEQRTGVASLTAALEQAARERERAEQDWQREHQALLAQEQEIENRRRQLEALQTQLLEADTTLARLENEWRQTEGRERADLVRRERLLAEQAQIARSVADSEGQQQRLQEELTALRNEVSADEDRLAELRAQQEQAREGVAQLQRVCAGLREQLAVKRAQIELLEADEQQGRHFSDGARQLLDPANPLGVPAAVIVGALAAQLQVEPPYRVALEAVLRAWLDAVVVADDAAGREVLRLLLRNRGGPVRLLAAAGPGAEPAAAGVGERLRAHVTAAPPVAALVDRLLAGVWVVDNLEAVPQSVPPGLVYVTPEGTVVRGGGAFEHWRAEAGASNPVARRHQLVELRKTLSGLEDELALREGSLAPLVGEQKALELALQEAEGVLREHRRAVALKEGEFQIIAHAVRQARERLETVQWELQSLGKLAGEDETRRSLAARIESVRKQQAETRARLDSETARLRELERGRSGLYARATELRVRFSEAAQRVEHLTSQGAPQQARLAELEDLIRGRTENLARYAETVGRLNAEIREAEEQVTNLRRSLVADNAEVDALRRQLEEKAARLQTLADEVTAKRAALDQARAEKSALEVARAESRLRRENLVERVTKEYGITVEDVLKAPEPEWEGERPDGQIPYEAAIAELRSRIEALGPVNLVAIEECQELEERYAFLTNQQADLVRAKQQLVDMIRKINVTTAELFASTFAKINANFQTMFQRLFDGGAAKLVMINDEDVLETGIDIIARPPGKRLQSVSLLSGGERTLTAVALLFAIYLIKPSPFCLLDELDAALDESNIGRFVNLLKEFLAQSQFIVITHNRRTIAAASVIYGITMEEMGVSKVVSMKFSEYERSAEFQTDSGPGGKPGPARRSSS